MKHQTARRTYAVHVVVGNLNSPPIRTFAAGNFRALEAQLCAYYWPLRPRGISKASMAAAIATARRNGVGSASAIRARLRGGFTIEEVKPEDSEAQ